MKKTVSFFLVAALMLAVAVSLCGCSGERDQLVGEWHATLDMKEVFREPLTERGISEELLSQMSIKLPVVLTLSGDGSYRITADGDGKKAAVDQLTADLREMVRKTYENMAAQSGMTLDALLAAAGTDMETAIDEAMTDVVGSLDLDGTMKKIERTGKWDAASGHLFRWDANGEKNEAAYEEYTAEGDTVTLTGATGKDAEAFPLLYPVVFTRAE